MAIYKKILRFIPISTAIVISFFVILILTFFIIISIEYVDITGEIKPIEFQLIQPKIEGVLKKKYFKEGDLVKKGDTLIEMDSAYNSDEMNKLIIEKDSLTKQTGYHEKNKKNLLEMQRINKLKGEKDLADLKLQIGVLISERDYQKKAYDFQYLLLEDASRILSLNNEITQNKNKVTQLEFQIHQLQDNINNSKIYAQTDGLIIEDDDSIKEDSIYSPGVQIQKLYPNGKVYAEIKIPEGKIAKIEVNQNVILYVTALPFIQYKVFKGKLVSLKKTTLNVQASILNSNQGFYLGKVVIDDPYFEIRNENDFKIKSLLFGMSLNGKIAVGKTNLVNKLLGLQ